MKKIVVLLVALVLFPKLYLASENYFYLDEPIEGIYTTMDKIDKVSANYVKPVRMVGTNEYVYCVTPGIAINPSGNYLKITSNQWNTLNISKEKYEKMQIISYYGYLYKGHTDLKWYAVTQYLIWQEVMPSGWNVYFTKTLRGELTHDFDWMINEINTLVNNYYLNPNISLTLEGNYKSDVVFNDSNGVLNNYIPSNTNVFVNNNSLTLKPSNDNYSFSLNYNTNGKSPNLYIYNNAQWVMDRGSLPLKSIDYNVVIPKGSLKLTKGIRNKDDIDIEYTPSLKGAKYHIFNDNYDQVLETDSNGVINLSNLNIDSYYIKEVLAPKDFELDETLYLINIEKNKEFNLKVYDDLKIGKINIFKKYLNTDTNTYEEEQNIFFAIKDENNKVIVSKKTDYNGFVSFSLPLSLYTVSQISSLEGYDRAKEEEIDLNIERFVSLTYYNKPIIKFSESIKEQEENENPIEEVTIDNHSLEEPLAPSKKENTNLNPKTSDNIYYQLIFLISSIIILIAKILKISKKKKEIKEK